MKAIIDGCPGEALKSFGYVKCYSQSKPGITAEHGIFWYNRKKYLIEFVKFVADGVSLRWVVSKVSVYLDDDRSDRKELIYHSAEERMINTKGKRVTFLVVVNQIPFLGVFDADLGLVKAYEMEDLSEGVMVRIGSECLRFRPQPYEHLIQKKAVVSFVMGRNFTLLQHEESKQQYGIFTRFFVDNHTKESPAKKTSFIGEWRNVAEIKAR